MNKLMIGLVSLSIIFVFVGCQPKTETKSTNEQQQNVALGPEQTYMNNCASCHGQTLEGGLGPSLDKIGSKLSKEEISDIIKNGKNGMPSQPQVSTEARDKLAEWLVGKK